MSSAATRIEWPPEAVRRRLPVDFPVMLEPTSGDRREVGLVVNLSPNGIFAGCRMLLPQGTPVRVTFYVPLAGGARPLVTTARVRWTNDPAAPRAPELPGGMGLEFVGLDGRSRADVEAFLSDLMAPEG